jgi:hypothetical protein
MITRQPANQKHLSALLNLIERKFSLRLPTNIEQLKMIREHYKGKRNIILWEHGAHNAMKHEDYAKAVLISEVARLVLREIDPWPRRKKIKGNKNAK